MVPSEDASASGRRHTPSTGPRAAWASRLGPYWRGQARQGPPKMLADWSGERGDGNVSCWLVAWDMALGLKEDLT